MFPSSSTNAHRNGKEKKKTKGKAIGKIFALHANVTKLKTSLGACFL